MTNKQLIQELKDAKKAEYEARTEVELTKLTLGTQIKALRQAEARVDEIIDELTTGKSRHPLIEAIEAKGTRDTPASEEPAHDPPHA